MPLSYAKLQPSGKIHMILPNRFVSCLKNCLCYPDPFILLFAAVLQCNLTQFLRKC